MMDMYIYIYIYYKYNVKEYNGLRKREIVGEIRRISRGNTRKITSPIFAINLHFSSPMDTNPFLITSLYWCAIEKGVLG